MGLRDKGFFAPYLALPYFLECLIVFFAAIGCRLSVVSAIGFDCWM
jgi:hypothetical protein